MRGGWDTGRGHANAPCFGTGSAGRPAERAAPQSRSSKTYSIPQPFRRSRQGKGKSLSGKSERTTNALLNPGRPDNPVKQKPPRPRLTGSGAAFTNQKIALSNFCKARNFSAKPCPCLPAARGTPTATPLPSPYSPHTVLTNISALHTQFHIMHIHFYVLRPRGPAEIPSSCSRGPSFCVGLVVCGGLRTPSCSSRQEPSPAAARMDAAHALAGGSGS